MVAISLLMLSMTHFCSIDATANSSILDADAAFVVNISNANPSPTLLNNTTSVPLLLIELAVSAAVLLLVRSTIFYSSVNIPKRLLFSDQVYEFVSILLLKLTYICLLLTILNNTGKEEGVRLRSKGAHSSRFQTS